MAIADQFPCLGLDILGMCSYNPAAPTPVYFTIGSAVAALGLGLAIQQFLKPIYLFRLRAYRIKLRYIILAAFLDFLCSVVAMLLPNLPVSHKYFFSYPIVWELIGGLLVAAAYGVVAIITLIPAQIYTFNLVPFVRAGSFLLSGADDTDRAGFAEDLLNGIRNLHRLNRFASAWARAEQHAIHLEFERLREIGAPLVIQGRSPPVSAFYEFAHRKELEAAGFAGTFLRIISDPQFCAVLAGKCAWLTAPILEEINEKSIYTDQAKPFVQEIAWQAILREDSLLAKEVTHQGFGAAPVFLDNLFGSRFILSHYDPLDKFHFNSPETHSEGYVRRLNGVVKKMLQTAIYNRDYWDPAYMFAVESAYKDLLNHWSYNRFKELPTDGLVSLHFGIKNLYELMSKGVEKLEIEPQRSLFVSKSDEYQHDLVRIVSSIIYESLTAIANRFSGVDDEAWLHAINIFQEVFPSIGSAPDGLDPVQQQLAIQIIDKLQQNMMGWYPAITRVLLAVIGPYDSRPSIENRTAFVILRDSVYNELKKIPELYKQDVAKLADFLPTNVTYDPKTNALTHRYTGGTTQTTFLAGLDIAAVDLRGPVNWRIPGRARPPCKDRQQSPELAD